MKTSHISHNQLSLITTLTSEYQFSIFNKLTEMKNLLLLFLVIIASTSTSAQEKELVTNYIENKVYADKSPAEYLIDNNKFTIPEGVMKDLFVGFEYGIKNTHRFTDLFKSKIQSSEFDTGGSISSFIRKPMHYLFILKILNYEIIENKSDRTGMYKFDADIKCFDIITGTNIIQTNIKQTGKLKSVNEIIYASSEMSKSLAKKIRETTNAQIRKVFPSVNYIKELGEIKGDKVKSIIVDRGLHGLQTNPKRAYAHIVDQEITFDDETIYTFKLVAELHTPGKGPKPSDIVFKVGDGKKEILTAFNEGLDIYVTTTQMGPKI